MKIREVIERHGMTMAELARKRGQTNSAVVQLVNGNPTVQKLRELAHDVGCNLWEFIEDEIEAAGFEVVKSEELRVKSEEFASAQRAPHPQPLPSEGRGAAGAEEQPSAGGQKTSEPLRPAGSIICPSCGEIIKLGVLR